MTSQPVHGQPQLILARDMVFADLHSLSGLTLLEQHFQHYLADLDEDLLREYTNFRADPYSLDNIQYTDFILRFAPLVEDFILDLFHIDTSTLVATYGSVADVLWFRQNFVLPASRKNYQLQSSLQHLDELNAWLRAVLISETITESILVAYAKQAHVVSDTEAMNRLQDWCHIMTSGAVRDPVVRGWLSFWTAKKRGESLLEVQKQIDGCEVKSQHSPAYVREDFELIDTYMTEGDLSQQSAYCAHCHTKQVDYCRSGFLQNKKQPDQGFRVASEGAVLSGCPVDEKISEMHWLKNNNYHVAALIAVMIDNPMCPATGHRICNDCIKSCIYQKQEAVDTPQVESGVLKDVLKLPWGVEIYDLLAKWNPLRRIENMPAQSQNNRVLVMGLGPSGFSLMHHLWMRGVTIVGMDGANVTEHNVMDLHTPIYDYRTLWENLADRRSMGFGGVAEYGITVRWDKNFLKLIYLSLARRSRLGMIGNVRFGGNLCVEDAWRLGFDHLALALGAGLPQALSIPHSLAQGMCQANDFLMSLQLTGAQHTANLAGLSMSLPCLVIGGGLTAVDAATEAQAFYLQFIKMIYLRIDALQAHMGLEAFWQAFSIDERGQLETWFAHGKALLAYRQEAIRNSQDIDYSTLLQSWGGVNIIYRKALEQAPSYRQNASELQHALDQGVSFHAHTTPLAVDVDVHGQVMGLYVVQPWQGQDVDLYNLSVRIEHAGHGDYELSVDSGLQEVVEGMVFTCQIAPQLVTYLRVLSVNVTTGCMHVIALSHLVESPIFLPVGTSATIQGPYRLFNFSCRQILVATGAKPNTAYEYEHRHTFLRQGAYYALHKWQVESQKLELVPEFDAMQKQTDAFFTSYDLNDKKVSVLGDLHPHYHGSVVKAIASAKHAILPIMQILPDVSDSQRDSASKESAFVQRMCSDFSAELVAKREIASDILILEIHAPEASRRAEVGHFFRLQCLPEHMPWMSNGYAGSEACALQMIGHNKVTHILTFMLRVHNVRTQILATAKVGESIACMGPTGVKLKMPLKKELVWICADITAFGQAVFYATEYQSKGHSVSLRLFVDTDEDAQVIRQYLSDFPDLDVLVIEVSLSKWLHSQIIQPSSINRLILQGRAGFVKSEYRTFRQQFSMFLHENAEIIGSVHGPMQCMLKGICSQCLQWQINPETGMRTKAVYSCSWQDQPLEIVDLDHTVAKVESNRGIEKLYWQWLQFDRQVSG